MNCRSCLFTDECYYASLPPKVKCTITNQYHYYDDICNCEEVRIQKETVENCLAQKLSEPFKQIDYTEDYTDVSVSGTLLQAEEASSYKRLLNPEYNAGTTCGCTATAVGVTFCLVCGDDIILTCYEGGPKICHICQKAIKFIKEKFKEELDNYEVY